MISCKNLSVVQLLKTKNSSKCYLCFSHTKLGHFFGRFSKVCYYFAIQKQICVTGHGLVYFARGVLSKSITLSKTLNINRQIGVTSGLLEIVLYMIMILLSIEEQEHFYSSYIHDQLDLKMHKGNICDQYFVFYFNI